MAIAQTYKATIEHKEGTQTTHSASHFIMNRCPPDSAKANIAMAGNIGEIAKTTEELAKTTDGIDKNTDEIANNTNNIMKSANKIVKNTSEISNNIDEIKCSWSATSITCIADTETLPQGTR